MAHACSRPPDAPAKPWQLSSMDVRSLSGRRPDDGVVSRRLAPPGYKVCRRPSGAGAQTKMDWCRSVQ